MSDRFIPRKPRLTQDHVARVWRQVTDTDGAPPLRPLSQDDKSRVADDLLVQKGDDPFWIFAIGSLIWKPSFEHVERRRCIALGWRRSFCLELTNFRGTPEQPGLMLALARGGSCVGVAYRMPEDAPHARMMRLLDREIDYHEDVPWMRWLTLRGEGQAFRALAFYCAPRTSASLMHLSLNEEADRMAFAVGEAGSCAEYLHNTVTHLENLGIRDSYLWRLQDMVAGRIEALHPDLVV